MIYNAASEFSPNRQDVLIIKKNGTELTGEQIIECDKWAFSNYNHDTQDWDISEILEIKDWADDLIFSGHSDVIMVCSPLKKIEYAFACMFNDDLVEATIKEIFPHIKDIKCSSNRSVSGYYLQNWMKKYNFTLKDFITNDKYVIMSCTGYDCWKFWKLVDNGLINDKDIEFCSEWKNDEKN